MSSVRRPNSPIPARRWRTSKITSEGIKSVFKEPGRRSNGLVFDNQGRLHIAMLESFNLNGNTVIFLGTDGAIKTRASNGCNGVEWIGEKRILYSASGGLQKCNVDEQG